MGGSKEDGARLFSGVSAEVTRSNGRKLKYREFPLNIRKHFLLLACLNTGTSCPGSWGVFVLGGHQNPAGCGPEQPALACFEPGVGTR